MRKQDKTPVALSHKKRTTCVGSRLDRILGIVVCECASCCRERATSKIGVLVVKVLKLADRKRTKLDLEDAIVVLEAMVKHPKSFMKELKAIGLKYDKYGLHRGLD